MSSVVPSSEVASQLPDPDPDADSAGAGRAPAAAGGRLVDAPRAVVVIGPGQVATSLVLRSLGWEVVLASSAEAARHIARQHRAVLVFVRVSSSHLRSLRASALADVIQVALVDTREDAPLPGFDVAIAIDDVAELTAFVRSAAPTVRHLRAAADRTREATSDVMRKAERVEGRNEAIAGEG